MSPNNDSAKSKKKDKWIGRLTSQQPIKKNLPNENQIVLTFEDKETVDYIKTVCRRKGITLEGYILDNFEWDDQLPCLSDLNENEPITNLTCAGCDQLISGKCPDAVKEAV